MKLWLFWGLVAAKAAVYLAMILWSLPRIASYANGQTPFDLRPTGYTFEEAKAFLAALGPEGADFYRDVQHQLDLFFPALAAAVVFFAIVWLLPRRLEGWRYVIAAPVVLMAVFDWSENHAVGQMLNAGAEGLTEELAGTANIWTIAKATASTVAYTALLALLIWNGVARWRRRSNA